MGKHYENLEEAMCKELEMLDKKYAAEAGEMSVGDVEKADKLYHALKSAATYHAMKDAEEWEDDEEDDASGNGRNYRGRGYGGRYMGGYAGGRSYRRGRDSMGRYTSRDMYPEEMSERYDMYPRYPMSYNDRDMRY